MGIVDYISSIFTTPAPSLSACTPKVEPQAEDNTPRVTAPAGEELIVLSRADVVMLTALIDQSLNECSLPTAVSNNILGNSLPERNAALWLAVAGQLINTKYNAVKIGDVIFGTIGRMSAVDAQIREAIAALTVEERIELIKAVATKLDQAHADNAPLFDNLSIAGQNNYARFCGSEKPAPAIAAFREIPLAGVTKQELLKMAQEAKKPAVQSCSAQSIVDCLGSGAIDAASRRQILTPFYPFSEVCELTPAAGKQGQELVVTLNGALTGILNQDNSLASEFAVNFGAGITPAYGTPVTSEGVVTSLPVTITIDGAAATGARNIMINFGELVLQTLGFNVQPAKQGSSGSGHAHTQTGATGPDPCAGKVGIMLSGCCRNHQNAASCQ
jgi:hypothetical protein